MEEIALSAFFSSVPAVSLEECNRLGAPFGLTLTPAALAALRDGGVQALRGTGRVEFGGGILKPLILAFRDSPYLMQENYTETLHELQALFYHLKNALFDRIPDDELLDRMRRVFDGTAQGSTEFLSALPPEGLLWLSEPGRRASDPDAGEWRSL